MSEGIGIGSSELRPETATSESWLRRHADLFALAIVAMGFGLRVLAARERALSGDEALNFLLVSLPRALDVYRESLSFSHPPLFFLLEHFWVRLGNSEFFLRLFPVAAGGAFLWVAYRWVLILFNRSAALMTLILLSFSPALVSLSADVRDYSLLLLLMTAALLSLERALEERSSLSMAASTAFLGLAVLTHYSAFFVVLAMFVYGLIRLRRDRLPARVVKTWAACQVGVGVLCLWLASTHVGALRGGETQRSFVTRMLRAELFQADQDRVLDFLTRQTAAFFRFLCGSATAGAIASVLALVGLVVLARKKNASVVLLALPFLSAAGASLMDAYPYGGTRHCAFLLVFAAAAVGVALSALSAGRLWPAVALFVVLASPSLAEIPGAPELSARRMRAAIDRFRAAAPAGSLLFSDFETGNVLDYYLEPKTWTRQEPGLQNFWEISAGGYRIVSSPIWNATEFLLAKELRRCVEVYRLPPGQVIRVMHVGRNYDLSSGLSRGFPGATLRGVSKLDELSYVEVVVP